MSENKDFSRGLIKGMLCNEGFPSPCQLSQSVDFRFGYILGCIYRYESDTDNRYQAIGKAGMLAKYYNVSIDLVEEFMSEEEGGDLTMLLKKDVKGPERKPK